MIWLFFISFVVAAAWMVLFVGGAWVVWRGLHGAPADLHPYCIECGYDVHGLYGHSQHCPECGSALDLPGALRVGRARPRWRMVRLGGVMCAAGLMSAGGYALVMFMPEGATTGAAAAAPAQQPQAAALTATPNAPYTLLPRRATRRLPQQQASPAAPEAPESGQQLISPRPMILADEDELRGRVERAWVKEPPSLRGVLSNREYRLRAADPARGEWALDPPFVGDGPHLPSIDAMLYLDPPRESAQRQSDRAAPQRRSASTPGAPIIEIKSGGMFERIMHDPVSESDASWMSDPGIMSMDAAWITRPSVAAPSRATPPLDIDRAFRHRPVERLHSDRIVPPAATAPITPGRIAPIRP